MYISRFLLLFTHSFIFRIDYYNIDTKRIFLLLTRAVKMSVKLSFYGGGVDGIRQQDSSRGHGTALFLILEKLWRENKYFDEFLKPRSLNGLGISSFRPHSTTTRYLEKTWSFQLKTGGKKYSVILLLETLPFRSSFKPCSPGSLRLYFSLSPDIPVYTSLPVL